MKVTKIEKTDDGYKEWADVTFDNGGRWRPKLIELAVIARIIYEVENNKYRVEETRARGGEMVRDFLNDALDGDPIERLKIKYKLTDEYLNSLKKK